jgi:opacity protein-like surface antigen
LVFDAGVSYATGFKGFSFGMSIRNFSTNLKREEIDEQLPLLFSLGAAVNLMEIIDEEFTRSNSVLFAIDFLHPNNYSERVNMGLEYQFQQMIILRVGYQTNQDLASWSAGLGFNTSINDYKIGINYSYSEFDYFDNVQRISLNFSF